MRRVPLRRSRGFTRLPAVLSVALGMTACEAGQGDARDDVLRSLGLTAPSIEGQFEQRVASMYDGSSRVSYHVRTPDGVKDLVTDEVFDLAYRTPVRVWGEFEGDYDFVLDELEVLGGPPQPLIDPEAYPHRRIATVLLFWNQQALSNEQAKNDMFISADSTNVFYGENSYGKETIAGNVFGPYEIPEPTSCNTSYLAEQGLLRFIDNGHDPDEYQQFMWHFPSRNDCGFAGLANSGGVLTPGRDTWYNGTFGCVVRAQEIGHNYGMGHSHSWACPDGTIVPTADECNHVEYGDPFDPMGGGCNHMNVAQKIFMGWLEGCNIVETTSDGLFNVSPTELPCNGTQALKFPSYDPDLNYYVEYRQSYGVDEGFDAVLLHWSRHENPYSPSPYIIEAGTDESGDETYFMGVGDTFTDPMGTVSFTVVEMLGTHATIQVTFPDGGSGEPVCGDGTLPESAGGAIGLVECAEAPFGLDITPPAVEIVSPGDGDVFEVGADFIIQASATDDRAVTEAELYLQIIGVDDQPLPLFKVFDPNPKTGYYEYEVSDIPEGEYLFGFVVRDGPNSAQSEPIVIEVRPAAADSSGGGESSSGGAVDPDTGEPASTGSGESSGGGAAQDVDAEGCGCSQDGGRGPWFAALVIAIARRRRRPAPR
jgi:hypothetical protein